MTTVARPWSTRWQLAAGVGLQVVLLAALSAGAGLGPVGWSAGLGCAAGVCALLHRAARRAGITALGPADLVTLVRAVLVGGVTGLVAERVWGGGTGVAALVALAAAALVLDAVDGQVARRTGTASALGARFDMETDAFLLLVLSVHVATGLGPWTLAVGGLRYAFVAAGWALPWLRGTLPVRYSAKAVAAVAGIALVVAGAEVLARPLAAALVATALALLTWSFGRSVACLSRARRPPGAPGAAWPGAARPAAAVGGLLALLALLAPNEIGALAPGAFVRLPVESVLTLALLAVLPVRAARLAGTVGGLALGLLAVLKAFDMGFFTVLGRPFDPVLDWSLLPRAAEFLAAALGPAAAVGAVVLAAVLACGVLVLVTLSLQRLAGVVVRRRATAARAAAALAVVWVSCAVLGTQIVPGVPVASGGAVVHAYDRALQIGASLEDREAFAAKLAVDAFRDTPADRLLTALRGKDVVIAFVESYGRDAIEDPEFAGRVGAVLDAGTRRLAAAGFAARSAFLTSPTAGGGSWLAHATLLSGLRVDNELRHRELEASDRLTLSRAFHRAGWRTVGIMPGVTSAWPEAAFYGYDRVYAARDLGYRGPHFSWATMPDQYSLSAFERLERAPNDRAPVMAVIPLVSSHAPWEPVPRLVDWDEVGNGAVFASMAAGGAAPAAILTRDPARVRTDYRRSLEYSLSTLVSYVAAYGDDDLVLVVLGDHQPAPVVTGESAVRDVPVTIVARDPAVLDRIAGWGWADGLKPGPQAPVWPMDTFRDRFLRAFG